MEVILLRDPYSSANGTFGTCNTEGMKLGYTVERPYKDNIPYESSVPLGSYKLIPYESDKYGKCFLLENSELDVYTKAEDRERDTDRFGCIFAHVGNRPHEFQGCIGMGDSYNKIGGYVTNTALTVNSVMAFLYSVNEGEGHTLEIIMEPF